jgi:multiple sugar transport system substrate-binding protein
MPAKKPRVSAQLTRRALLMGTGVGLAAGVSPGLSRPFVARALAADKELSILQWSHFVPAFDRWFDQFAQDWGNKNNISVTVDHIPEQNIAARAAAEASARSGHDLFMWNGAGGAHLYRKFLVDVTALIDEMEQKYGKVSTIGRQIAFNEDNKTWSAFPDFYINNPGQYRKDLWDEIGMVPDTWENVRIGGAKLKAKGHPVGCSLAHSNDPNLCWRGVLWSYGGSVQDGEGKKIVLDSKETVEAVKFTAALYREAMTNEVLSWDDSSNNKYIDSGVGCFIINPNSSYRTAQQMNPKLADNIAFLKCPKGPVRRMVGAASNCYGIWHFAKNKDAAMDFLRHYAANWVDAFKASTGYNMPIYANIVPKPMPILSNDPTSHPQDKLAILQTSDEWCAVAGYPGPAWPATDEIYNDFVICDMMTQAATGALSAEDSVNWATRQCEAIFKKWQS